MKREISKKPGSFMLDTRFIGDELKALGFDFYSGVPCSFLKYLINYAINHCQYIAAANEGDAVAVCAGAYLGGRKSVVLMQNSGLTNATSPLASLNPIYNIPVLGFVSLRGQAGVKDEPQHELMGKITEETLTLLDIPHARLSKDRETALTQLKRANQYIEDRKSFFFVVEKDTFEPHELLEIKSLKTEQPLPSRRAVLEALVENSQKDWVLLATTGYTGRELAEVADRENHLYMVGSMGCVSSLGLGLSYSRKDIKCLAIDGDGSLLMRMGSLATNAYYRPKNLLHILLDNGCHESTGSQFTVSSNLDFARIAEGSGYANVKSVSNLPALIEEMKIWDKNPELTFLYMKIQPGVAGKLSRPGTRPKDVAQRLMKFLGT
jgi:phosphonopyruvate decarboxylase